MAGLDTTQGKLIFPPRFVPYLEKHRIFELFHELTELLVQERPKDHIQFLKTVLPCAARRRDKPRIVILAPPTFDTSTFGEEIGRILKIVPINRYYMEMKERERRLMERMKKEKGIHMPPEEEELSCICPGEDFGEYEIEYKPPSVLGESFDDGKQVVELYKKTSVSEEEEEQADQGDPCKGYRVCPCKANQLILQQMGFGTGEPGQQEDMTGTISADTDSEEDHIPREAVEPKSEQQDRSLTTTDTSCVCESSSSNIMIDYSVLKNCEFSELGWVLLDFPQDAVEAERLCSLGVIPTHAIRIITGTEDERSREYKYYTKDWMNIYKSIPVLDIHAYGRSPLKLAEDVSRLLAIMPHRHAPMLFRIVLIGSRGSGVTTQAKLLSEKYKLVHVDFEVEVARMLEKDDHLHQMYKSQLVTRPDPELEAALLEKVLMTRPCRKHGWVLTGYPTNSDQLRMLDIMATPPNRVIFIEVPAKECFIRLFYRKMDYKDGTEYKLPVIEPFGVEHMKPVGIDPEIAHRLLPHPRDDRRIIINDIEKYFDEKEEMMKYCGATAAVINGNKPIETVFELIQQVLVNPAPAQPPRDPLAINHGIVEAYKRLRDYRMHSGYTCNNLVMNPPDPIFPILKMY